MKASSSGVNFLGGGGLVLRSDILKIGLSARRSVVSILVGERGEGERWRAKGTYTVSITNVCRGVSALNLLLILAIGTVRLRTYHWLNVCVGETRVAVDGGCDVGRSEVEERGGEGGRT